jgi:ribosomal protein S18 acetylase RimI-like enzyme
VRAAPLRAGDAAEITAVWRACERHDVGRPEIVAADVVAFLGGPRLDFERDTVGLRAGGELVALGVQLGERLTFVRVLPAWRGRGLGRWLVRWSQEAARALGAPATAQSVSEHERAATALLEAEGYERRWEEWRFEIALDAEPAAPAPPAGYAIRSVTPKSDERAAFDVIERAFSAFPERPPRSFDGWAATVFGRPGFAPDLLALAVRGDDVVGAVLVTFDEGEGYVEQLAVAQEHRGRGLARALLQHAFGVTWRRGGRVCALSTDSRTGARGLYEHVGMRVRTTYYEYVKQL